MGLCGSPTPPPTPRHLSPLSLPVCVFCRVAGERGQKILSCIHGVKAAVQPIKGQRSVGVRLRRRLCSICCMDIFHHARYGDVIMPDEPLRVAPCGVTRTHALARSQTHTHTHTHKYTHMHTHTRTHTRERALTYISTHVRTRNYTYTTSHTCRRAYTLVFSTPPPVPPPLFSNRQRSSPLPSSAPPRWACRRGRSFRGCLMQPIYVNT